MSGKQRCCYYHRQPAELIHQQARYPVVTAHSEVLGYRGTVGQARTFLGEVSFIISFLDFIEIISNHWASQYDHL